VTRGAGPRGVHHRLLVASILIVTLALLVTPVLVTPAWASANRPTGAYALFAGCPLGSDANLCMVSDVTGGEVVVGKKLVPISKTIELQGGLNTETETGEIEFVGAEEGDTLAKVALPVPGGLLSLLTPALLPGVLQESVESVIHGGMSAVTATLELAQPAADIELSASNLLDREATALQLPVKVRLGNPFLGSNCYIGSEADPIVLNLTTGTTSPPSPNKPIKGGWRTLGILEGASIITLGGTVLVDNAWASPAASGCGGAFSSVVDAVIDAQLGLPSRAGHNTAILRAGTLELAAAEAVRLSE
jgi:hypothetical protein